MPENIIRVGIWCYFEGRKYWEVDIDTIGESCRQADDESRLTSFLKRCLRKTENQALGIPMTEEDFAVVNAAERCAVAA